MYAPGQGRKGIEQDPMRYSMSVMLKKCVQEESVKVWCKNAVILNGRPATELISRSVTVSCGPFQLFISKLSL